MPGGLRAGAACCRRIACAAPASAHRPCRLPQTRLSYAGPDWCPGAAADRGPLDVQDRGACGAKRVPGGSVVVPAQQQLGLMRPTRAGGHDGDHHRPGRTAEGMIRLLHSTPVDDISAGLILPRRQCSGSAGMQELHAHIIRIAFLAAAGQGPRLPTHGTKGHCAASAHGSGPRGDFPPTGITRIWRWDSPLSLSALSPVPLKPFQRRPRPTAPASRSRSPCWETPATPAAPSWI